MKVRTVLSLAGIFLAAHASWAQPDYRIDTLSTQDNPAHMYLHLKVPLGEIFMRASHLEGQSICKLLAPHSMAHQRVVTRTVREGVVKRTVALQYAPATPKSPAAGAAMRLSEGSPPPPSTSPAHYRTEYCPDASLSTDLFLDLGQGSSLLNLSGLNLRKVHITSAFSDVLITYDEANQVEMEDMDIQVANAKVVLKNLELARARRIHVQNDMGETKLVLGDAIPHQGEIFIEAGVGDCTLIIDVDQPVKLSLKSGIFSQVDVKGGFTRKPEGTYSNPACDRNPAKCVRIDCDVDFGNITVLEKE